MGSSSRSGQRDKPVDPFGNAISLAESAEKRARRTGDLPDMLAVSTQWLAIAQIHQELSQSNEPRRSIGFTGGSND